MKGRNIGIAIFLALWSIAAIAPDFLSLASQKNESQALAGLGVTYPEAGNAAETYLPYLKGEKPIIKDEALANVSTNQIFKPEEKDRQAVKDLVAKTRPDLDALLAASRQSDYRLWGTLYNPPTDQHPYAFDMLQYVPFMKLVALLVADARDTSDPKAAEEKLLAAVRIGQHLDNDGIILGFVVGSALKKNAGFALADFYAAQGKAELAEKWKKQAERDDLRVKEIRKVIAAAADWEEEDVTALVRNPDLPIAMKIEVIIEQHYCLGSQARMAACKLTGAPGWVKKLEGEMKDPAAQAIFPLLNNELSWKEIRQSFD